MAADLALALADLLIRKHGSELRAPVDGDLGLVGKAMHYGAGRSPDFPLNAH